MAHEAMDLTAEYPLWFQGKRYMTPPKLQRSHEYMSWMIAATSQVLKQTLQLQLIGNLDDPNGLGTGFIPLDAFVGKISMSRAGQNVADSFTVRRSTGGSAFCGFKTREQAFPASQAPRLTRLDGMSRATYGSIVKGTSPHNRCGGWPLDCECNANGNRDLLYQHLTSPSPNRAIVRMALTDATHLSKNKSKPSLTAHLPRTGQCVSMASGARFGFGRLDPCGRHPT